MMENPYVKYESCVDSYLLIFTAIGCLIITSSFFELAESVDFRISEIYIYTFISYIFIFILIIMIAVIGIVIRCLVKMEQKKKMQEIMKSGYKTAGKVLTINRIRKHNRGYEYSLIVQFVDQYGLVKTFETNNLDYVPKPGYYITCDVFVYSYKYHAYNFSNFYIDKNLYELRRIMQAGILCCSLCIIMGLLFVVGVLWISI